MILLFLVFSEQINERSRAMLCNFHGYTRKCEMSPIFTKFREISWMWRRHSKNYSRQYCIEENKMSKKFWEKKTGLEKISRKQNKFLWQFGFYFYFLKILCQKTPFVSTILYRAEVQYAGSWNSNKTLTYKELWFSPLALNWSAQPGMNLGDWKNHSRIRMIKKTNTCNINRNLKI